MVFKARAAQARVAVDFSHLGVIEHFDVAGGADSVGEIFRHARTEFLADDHVDFSRAAFR